MTPRDEIEAVLRDLYAARVRGDVDGVMKHFAADATYRMHSRGTGTVALRNASRSPEEIRLVIGALIQAYKFSDWRLVSLIVEGERAALHWRSRVMLLATGKAEEFDGFDTLAFRDGKIVECHQAFDTALVLTLYPK